MIHAFATAHLTRRSPARIGLAMVTLFAPIGLPLAGLTAPPSRPNPPTTSPTTSPPPTNPTPSQPQPNISSDQRFACEQVNGQNTVMYYPESQPGQRFAWVTPSTMSSYWSSDRRCQEIANRLESYRPDGLLELGNGIENGYDTVCVTTEANATCRIVLTVPPGEDPQMIRDQTFQNIVIADGGTQTQPVSALNGGLGDFGGLGDLGGLGEDWSIVGDILGGSSAGQTLRITDSSDWIDLRPFLDPADGGTAAQLTPGRAVSDTRSTQNDQIPRFNPDAFR